MVSAGATARSATFAPPGPLSGIRFSTGWNESDIATDRPEMRGGRRYAGDRPDLGVGLGVESMLDVLREPIAVHE